MNYKVKTINNISDKGLDILKNKGYAVGEEESEPDAIILRSHKLQMSEIPSSVKAIVRAGAGVNNIPVEGCSKIKCFKNHKSKDYCNSSYKRSN